MTMVCVLRVKKTRKNLRNQMFAYKFANKYLHIMKTRRDIFQAIADPTRRAIIVLIAVQALTPNAIAEHFKTTRQAVSNHLQILTECGLINQEQQGREIYYQLEVNKMKEMDKWLEQFRRIWESRFDNLDKFLAQAQKKKNSEKDSKKA